MEDFESQQNLEFVCETCKRTFSKKSKLSRHVRESHLNIKNFNCTLCNKTFKRNSHLKRHMISHSEEPKPFKCNQCSMQFACKHHLERHLKTLHAEDFPFQCDICLLRFPKRASLFKHLTFIHNLNKPHKCCECDKDFFKNGQLIRHLKRVHPNSYNAQQQLLHAQDYQVQQRIQANLALKNDKKDKNSSSKAGNNQMSNSASNNNSNSYYNAHNLENNLYAGDNYQLQYQNNSQNPTATCYYYSLESQIQNLNHLNSNIGQEQQPQSSATSVISFSSSSYPSSSATPVNLLDQNQQCYKNMIDRYYTFDEIDGDEYEGEEEEDEEDSEDEVYNMIFKQSGDLKKKVEEEDDDNSFYLVSAAANAASLRSLPLKKEKKIKKDAKLSNPSKRSRAVANISRKYSLKNEDLFMLDNNGGNNNTLEELQQLPGQMRKLSEEIFCHLGGLIGTSSAQNNFGNMNSYFMAAEDELLHNNGSATTQQQLQQSPSQQQQLESTLLENNYAPSQSYGSAVVAQNAVSSSAVGWENINEKMQLQQQQQQSCTETLISNSSSNSSSNVATSQQQQQQYNINNMQNNNNFSNNYSLKHEQEQQNSSSAQGINYHQIHYSNNYQNLGNSNGNNCSGGNSWSQCQSGAAIQGNTLTQKVCYVPSCASSSSSQSMQPTQKQYSQQQYQSQNSQIQSPQSQLQQASTLTATVFAKNNNYSQQSQSQPQQSLGIQVNNQPQLSSSHAESISVKNEDNGAANNAASAALLPFIYHPVDSFLNHNSNSAFKAEEDFHAAPHTGNEVNFDFLNLMDQQQQPQYLLNSDFIQMNSLLMMDYSQKFHHSQSQQQQQTQQQTTQYQLPQFILPLSQNGLHSSQHMGINYASIAKTM